MKPTILIAGGTGLIGKALTESFESLEFQVFILTRNKARCSLDQFRYWNPDADEIADNALDGIDCIINLCGSGIADKRWTAKRKKELYDSRINPTKLLFKAVKKQRNIKHYLSASGINCYPVNTDKQQLEADAYGSDYLSALVQSWEEEALKFETLCPVTLLRISAVLSNDGGALAKLKPLFKFGLGSPLGSGKQPFTWVHEADLVAAIVHLTEQKLAGAYNICGTTISNRTFSASMAKTLKRWMLPIGVPSFLMKLMLGEMSAMLLDGVNTNAEKLKATGFTFQFEDITKALSDLNAA